MPRSPLILGSLVLALGAVSLATTVSTAAPVDLERVQQIAIEDRPAWVSYLERSARLARKDEATLARECAAAGRRIVLRPPSGAGIRWRKPTHRAAYGDAAAQALADTILSFQSPAGGWSKRIDYSAGPRQPGTQWTAQNVPGKPPHYLATFDNHATTSEIWFLAHVAEATGRQDCRHAVERGIRFILDAQYPNGGWPQVYPLEGKYHDAITYNDDVMIDVLMLLQAVADGGIAFAFLDQPMRDQAAMAVRRGLECVLATQIVLRDRTTGWCGQYDALTLMPSAARAFEPAALGGLETSQILRWLMTLPDPSDRVVAAIEAGLRWLADARVTGLTQTSVDGEPMFVDGPSSREVYWARFYDLATGRPIFPGRDGVIYDTFQAMAANNRVDYHYLSDQPESTLTTAAAKWRKQSARTEEK